MSSTFETVNIIQVYETNGVEEKGLKSQRPKVKIKGHATYKTFVVIEVEGKSLTVSAQDLLRAIQNAQNAHS